MPGFKRGSENHIKYLEKQIEKLRKENEELKKTNNQEQLLKDIHKDLTESMSLVYSKVNNIEKARNIARLQRQQEYYNQLISDEINETLANIKNDLPIYRSVNIYIWISDIEMNKTRKYYN